MIPRGIRNNNPGNIDHHDNTRWLGEVVPSHDGRFCTFVNMACGIRAIAKLLLTYQNKYSCRTVSDFIHRWAPPTENDTGAYVAAVSLAVGVTPTATIVPLTPQTTQAMVRAIIMHENGHPQAGYPKSWVDDHDLVMGVGAAHGTVATGEVLSLRG
jgi:hypothetical protein